MAADPVSIKSVDFLKHAIIVVFSDGTNALFDAQFLFEHARQAPNRVIDQNDIPSF